MVCKDMLRWKTIPARVVNVTDIVNAEIDENEIRRAFTTSERVAIMNTLRGYQARRAAGSDQYALPATTVC